MKRQQRFAAILAAVMILSGSFPIFAAETGPLSEEEASTQESTAADSVETAGNEETPIRESTAVDSVETADNVVTADVQQSTAETAAEEEASRAPQQDTECFAEEEVELAALTETEPEIPEETDEYPLPKEKPGFDVEIKFSAGDYVVMGTFTEFTPDIESIDTLYSIDGVNWETAIGGDWNLCNIGTSAQDKLYSLQNQPCLRGGYEPLKSYKEGKIERFFLKLRISKKNGLFYETQSAVIERGGVQPIPQGMTVMARFSDAIRVTERRPYRQYGKYQLTIGADATAEDVSVLLPDTLPVEVQLLDSSNFCAICVVDCHVTWKSLSLPPLTAGESITIPDAAEEVLVPRGTVLNTPLGAFVLDQALSLGTDGEADEVKLVLNISPENQNPTGGLRQDRDGLEIALHQKPTDASSIQAYVITEGESEWTELCGLSLLKELNAQLSVAGSGYALVLRNDQEPYRSYLEAQSAGKAPVPFFVGLKFEGGIYDGKQLVLAWPDRYEQIPVLPKLGGTGGNEGNAGADNKDDSTESGQRPNLPQPSDEEQENKQQPSEDSEIKQQPSDNSEIAQQPSEDSEGTRQPSKDSEVAQQPSDNSKIKQQPSEDSGITRQPSDDSGLKQPDLIQMPEAAVAAEIPENQSTSATMESVSEPAPVDQKPEVSESGQRPDLPQITQDTADSSPADQGSSGAVEWIDHTAQTTLVVQAATDIKDENGTAVLSDMGAVVEQGREDDNRAPLLPVTIAVSAVICISATACKVTGFGLFHRIAGIIRNVLHK